MKIVHRVSCDADVADSKVQQLVELQVEYEFAGVDSSHGILTFEILESDSRWPDLEAISRKWNAVDNVRTEFSRSELENATHLAIRPQWVNGYPMPDDDDGYLRETYSATGCSVCGAKRTQTAPFRLLSAPKWGRRMVMVLNWIPDELFVSSEATDAFADFGVASREVMHHKTSKVLGTVRQLVVPKVTSDHALDLVGRYDECGTCGITRYPHQVRGWFPPLLSSANPPHVFKTYEVFGEGSLSWSEIIVSGPVYRKLVDLGARGINFQPLRPAGTYTLG